MVDPSSLLHRTKSERRFRVIRLCTHVLLARQPALAGAKGTLIEGGGFCVLILGTIVQLTRTSYLILHNIGKYQEAEIRANLRTENGDITGAIMQRFPI